MGVLSEWFSGLKIGLIGPVRRISISRTEA